MERLALSAAVLLLFVVPTHCGYGRIFWEDEMLGWLLLTDPSWKHMLFAWKQGADGGGLSFYILGRLWFTVFGPSIMAFRMFSTTCFAAGAVVAWITLRRFYATATIFFSLLSVWLVSPLLVQYMTFGRYYGLLMAATCAAVGLAIRYDERAALAGPDLALVFLVHAFLTTTHQLGILYSFAAILTSVVLDRLRHRWRPQLYAAAAAAWLLLIPELPAIRASARVGQPHFWTTQPGAYEFALIYTAFTPIVALLLVVVTAFVLLRAIQRRTLPQLISEAFTRRAPLWVAAGALSLVPVILYLEGHIGPVLCIGRYLQPVALATTISLAELSTLALTLLPAGLPRGHAIPVLGWAAYLALLLSYDLAYRSRHSTLQRDYTAELTRALPVSVPVVPEDAFSFTELISRQHQSPVKYTYLLDWNDAISSRAPKLEVTQFHLMENWKTVGYYSGSISYIEPFLRDTPVFYTLSFRDYTDLWPRRGRFLGERAGVIGSSLHLRLAADPAYTVVKVKEVPLGELYSTVWRICRKDAPRCDRPQP